MTSLGKSLSSKELDLRTREIRIARLYFVRGLGHNGAFCPARSQTAGLEMILFSPA